MTHGYTQQLHVTCHQKGHSCTAGFRQQATLLRLLDLRPPLLLSRTCEMRPLLPTPVKITTPVHVRHACGAAAVQQVYDQSSSGRAPQHPCEHMH